MAIDTDAVLDKLWEVGPWVIGGYLIYSLFTSRGGTKQQPEEEQPEPALQWVLQARIDGQWTGYGIYPSRSAAWNSENARTAREKGYALRVVRL